jgi:glycerophosphoryl diester phosphodiesterase
MVNKKNVATNLVKTFFLGFLLLFISCDETSEATNNPTPETIDYVVDNIRARAEKEILVCAHRAYHKFVPENSIASIEQAIEAKIDIVEVDVNTTKDGILVLMHDNSIDRTTNGKGWISDFTFAELQQLFLTKEGVVTTHKIPTLGEVLSVAKGKIILNLDIKRVDVAKLYQQLKINKMQNDVFSFIWDKRKIDKILAIDTTYAVLPEVSNKAEMEYYLENVRSKLQHFNESSFTSENVAWAKTKDIQIFMNSLWEADEEFIERNFSSVDEIIALKPAIIQTDHPKLILDYLKSKNLHH